MRTTLTLDDDVAAGVEKIRLAGHEPLKTIINEALRRGLLCMAQKPEQKAAYHTRSVEMGRCRLPRLDDVAEALAIAEGDMHP